MKKILSFILIILMMCSLTLAHSGRTDSNGGHYNRSTGEYHYHHGYPAHDHENGICPYSYNDKTNSSSSTSNSSSKDIIKDNEENKKEQLTFGQIILSIVMFLIFGGPFIFVIALYAYALFSPLWDWIKNKFNKK